MRLLYRAGDTLFIELFNHSQGEFSSLPNECEEGICKFRICWWHLISVEEDCKFWLTSMHTEWKSTWVETMNRIHIWLIGWHCFKAINSFWDITVKNLHYVLHYINTINDYFIYVCCPYRCYLSNCHNPSR